MNILLKVGVTAVALWIATLLIPGIRLGGDSIFGAVTTLILVAAIFGLVNAVLKPIIKSVGCAFYIATLGLIALVVNGLLFALVGWFAHLLGLPFEVADFWPSAVFGAVVVGVVSFVLHLVIPEPSD